MTALWHLSITDYVPKKTVLIW